MIKTYGVSGLIEWQCVIPAGRSRIKVHFSGGAITAYGVTPAEHTTSHPAMQALIENSDYFRSGRIRLIRTINNDPEPATAPTEAPQAKTAKQVKVASVDDAAMYLKEHFGIAKRNLTSREAIVRAAASRNIEFIFE